MFFFKCKLHYVINESNIFAYESSFNVPWLTSADDVR